MPTFKITPTNDQDRALQQDLCPDEASRFEKWCNRVELWYLATPAPDRAFITSKGLTMGDWFDFFNHGFTASEAIDAVIMDKVAA